MNRTDEPARDDPHAPAARALLQRIARPPSTWDSTREDALWRLTQARMNAESTRPLRRFQAFLALGGVATAGALVMALWAPQTSLQGASDGAVAAPRPLAESHTASTQDHQPTAPYFDSTGRFRLPSGALAERTPEALVEVVTATANETRLRLKSGAVTSEVPRLAPGQRYEVETASALVSVRGTRFAVAVDAPDHTLVSVEHGKVEVAPSDWRVVTLLIQGERRALAACGSSIEAAERSTSPRCIVEAFAARAAAATDPVARDTLLLKGALAASRTDPAEAVAWWRRARELSPSGVHAEEVAFRELEALGQAKQWAQRAERAQVYLQTFASSPRVSAVRSWVVPPR